MTTYFQCNKGLTWFINNFAVEGEIAGEFKIHLFQKKTGLKFLEDFKNVLESFFFTMRYIS